MGEEGLEPPDSEENTFTECPATKLRFILPLLFVPRDGYAPPPIVCKTITLLLRQRGKLYVSELPIYKHTN